MENKPKTEILEYNVNWNSIKRACMRTIGKDAGDKEPPKSWKKKILICRHSPIRKGWITWKWSDIPYAISTHCLSKCGYAGMHGKINLVNL